MRSNWEAPLIVKGALMIQDALRAKEPGADGIIVSNHERRQLDGAPATLRVLPSIADALQGDVEILLDSGVRRGIDVVKAMSLAARAVLIGRYPAFGLALGSQLWVSHVLERLRGKLVRSLQHMGPFGAKSGSNVGERRGE